MHTCGIITEYNPFHNGHAYQIAKAREISGCDTVIAVMSGNFVQRGEPAIVDKWKRAEAAVRNGADVVIELPYLYATQSASKFAHGGVHLLKMAGVDTISFGSECGNLENLMEIAETSVNPDHLREMMSTGLSYPKAYSLLTAEMQPNDILAVSYLKEIRDTDIRPVLIQRTGGYLDENIGENASAMAIRKALKEGADLHSSTPMEEVLLSSETVTMEAFWPYIRTFLITSSPDRLRESFLFSEGIENHLIKQAAASSSFEEFMNNAVTFRYTAGRIRRCLLHAMMQFTKSEKEALGDAQYLRVLAFNDQGRKWLAEMRESEINVASRFADIPEDWRKVEYRSTLLYTSVLSPEERNRILKDEIKGARYIR